jgi:NACalpha-BTF3-like transcription factor
MAETGIDESAARSALEAANGETSAALKLIRTK